MKNITETKLEYITDRIIIVEAIKENDEREFYFAFKYEFQKEEDNEFTPLCRAQTKEECLKKGITEYSTKFENLQAVVDGFFKKLSHSKNSDLDTAANFSIGDDKKECRFDNFIVEDSKAYFVNDWDEADAYNKKHNPEFYESYKNISENNNK